MIETAICVAILFAVVTSCAVASRNRAAFQERFPPITDAQFLTLCLPGVNPTVALRVRRIVAEHFAIAYERVHPSMTFIEDLGAD